jgi:D-alanyl-D-alanine carboxypeptidase
MSDDDLGLGEKQELFAECLGKLLVYAAWRGYRVRMGECYRPPETAALYEQQGRGIANSLHSQKLAADLNVFRGGQWLKASEDLAELGAFWKRLHPLCCWGGDFATRPDGNHFSVTYGGVR